MKISTFFLYLVLFPVLVFSQDLMQSWDSKIYNPKDFGLSSLSFDAKVAGLGESLKSTLTIPNISQVYFRVSWDKKNQFNVKLMGLPQGFNDLKNSLEMTMVDKLRFFIPTPFFEGFKDYNVTSKTIDTGFQYTLEDKTFLKDITKLEVFFNKENLLSKIEINGRETNIFTFDSTLADKKLLLKDLIIESGGSQGVFALSYSVEYQKINKYIFPKKIFISSQLQSSSKEGGQKQIFSEVKSEVIFSNFTVK